VQGFIESKLVLLYDYM